MEHSNGVDVHTMSEVGPDSLSSGVLRTAGAAPSNVVASHHGVPGDSLARFGAASRGVHQPTGRGVAFKVRSTHHVPLVT